MREEQLMLFDFSSAFDILSLNTLTNSLAGVQAREVDSEVDCKLIEMLAQKGCEWWNKVHLEAIF